MFRQKKFTYKYIVLCCAIMFFSKLLPIDLNQENNLPNKKYQNIHHVALVADGNRRWAKNKGLTNEEGHKVGFLKRTPELVTHLFNNGINTVTVWCFSTENWDRSKSEVASLMDIFSKMIDQLIKLAKEQEFRVIHIGCKNRLPLDLQQKLCVIEKLTQSNSEHVLFLAIDYGGRDEIVRSVKNIITSGIQANQIDELLISQCLDTHESKHPNPDLIIRTGGRTRLSGFLSWQASYSELAFLDCYFPDLGPETLDKELEKFEMRERTFGR